MTINDLSRRKFLELTALSAAALSVGAKGAGQSDKSATIALVAGPDDPIASATPAVWALGELATALQQRGVTVQHLRSVDQLTVSPGLAPQLCIVAAGCSTQFALVTLKDAAVAPPSAAESLALVPAAHRGTTFLLACGSDPRGLMYALLELADRVRYAENPVESLQFSRPVAEQPYNEVRSIGRSFVSEVQDKPWFNDRDMWPAYFSMLATQRINRFSLNFGIGFDTLEYVTDSYFLFAYPFLLAVPGYDVRAVNLPDDEREHNLEMLRYISRRAVEHGIDFQLGIWTHGYRWDKTPKSNYTISGVTPENHAAYSRDALAALLRACPDISGITIRTHGESGVREGSYDFWKTVFQGVTQCGRKVEIDLHPKGLNQTILDSALATGMPVKLSPKYWAEHMGLPYQQTAIRDLEMPRDDLNAQSYYSLSTGSRIFTRYGYADFLREDRPYKLIYRIWPGTHRFLLWGDPVSNAAHARAFRFCGSNGVELYEPLTFKGRRGSGHPGNRCAYADESLNPRHDWEKYLYTYRVWGRLLYNPDTDPDVWRRQLRREFRAGALAVESALGAATRIVPLITAAHLPSAANDTYGPEFYTNQPIVDENRDSPYHDTPAPKVFGNVSPLDPQMFSRIGDFAAELLKGERSGKYSPLEVAQWLEDLAATAAAQLAEAEKQADKTAAEFRRLFADVKIQIGLGQFFAAKFRSGVLYAIHEQSEDRLALEESLKFYRLAREIWAEFAQGAGRAYVADISYGPRADERGHWLDRLPAMDDDIAAMAARLRALPSSAAQSAEVYAVIQTVLTSPQRGTYVCTHTPPPHFEPGKDLEIRFAIKEPAKAVRVYYRHVNQAERYQSVEASVQQGQGRAIIPASYTDSNYPLQYYFELRENAAKASLYPGLGADLNQQPYFVVRSS